MRDLDLRLVRLGLTVIGGFHPDPGEHGEARTIILVGNAGSAMWDRFDPKPGRPAEHRIDHWCRSTLSPIAAENGASVVFPFDGPPYAPFVSWSFRTGRCFKSPLGMAIHDTFGLWFALRGALMFREVIDLEPYRSRSDVSPCETCSAKPCLQACPVDAFEGETYDHAACRDHVRDRPNACASQGCAARRACPLARAFIYRPAHAAYHMRSFAP
ncbi:ferredoxin [Minwuia sp.]|uniref:ferredoxin n=1 Tax=Minwuia sp. TaxID=2493630 RepID=UPI003A913DA7